MAPHTNSIINFPCQSLLQLQFKIPPRIRLPKTKKKTKEMNAKKRNIKRLSTERTSVHLKKIHPANTLTQFFKKAEKAENNKNDKPTTSQNNTTKTEEDVLDRQNKTKETLQEMCYQKCLEYKKNK